MRPPCEQNLRYLIPQLRAHLSQRLQHLGWSQNRIASELGITQAAVSGYLKQYRETSFVITPAFRETVDNLVTQLTRGEETPEAFIASVCHLCLTQRIGGPICHQHKEDLAILKTAGCTLCNTFPPSGQRESLNHRASILDALRVSLGQLQAIPNSYLLVPEVRTNMVYALSDAADIIDVAAFPGRITLMHNRITAIAAPEFGASTYTSRLLLIVKHKYPQINAAFCVKSTEAFIQKINDLQVPLIEMLPSLKGTGFEELTEKTFLIPVNDAKPILAIHATGQVGLESIIYLFADTPITIIETVKRFLD